MTHPKTALLDIVKFASIENEQLLVSFANDKDALAVVSHKRGSNNNSSDGRVLNRDAGR